MAVRKFFFGVVLFLQISSFAQSKVEVGGWYMHACYRTGKDMAIMDKILYYAVQNTIAAIDLQDNSYRILDKNAGLNDVGICCLGNSPTTKMLVICYENSNIDLYDGRTIFNVPDIYNKQIAGNKAINKVFCDDKYAYLACGIGIVMVDLKKKVVKDSWFFKKDNQTYEVNDIVIVNDTVYAATDYGIFFSKNTNPFINNFATWEQATNVYSPNNSLFKQFAVLNNTVYVLKNDTNTGSVIYVRDNGEWKKETIDIYDGSSNFACRFIQASAGRFLVGTNDELQCYQWNPTLNQLEKEKTFYWCYGMATARYAFNEKIYLIDETGLRWGDKENYTHAISIPGPIQNTATIMDWKKSKLALVHTTTSDWDPTWISTAVSILRGKEDWTTTLGNTIPFQQVDLIDVCIAPYDTSIVYAASYIQGLFEYRADTVYKVYTHTNSSLDTISNGSHRVARLAFDGYHNLWMTNWASSNPVSVLTKKGEWKSFNIPFIGENYMGAIFADSRNWIWVVYDRDKKMAIFNPDHSSGTINGNRNNWVDLNLSLKEEDGQFTYIHTITETKDGHIWMGTDKGIKIYYSPSRLMNEPNVTPQSIPVQVIKNGDTLVELVLGSERVLSIKVDGGNRKWVGTENAGVFLLSPDGKTELFHFTKENSPLPSNTVFNIAIDGETGDVYFGTEKGLISFRYTATDGKENYDNLKIFPNPVREDFNGYISISGLKDYSEVKITDAHGKLVYRTTSNGGTAVWDGRRWDGLKASTGVYFVFVTDETKTDKAAGKILVIK